MQAITVQNNSVRLFHSDNTPHVYKMYETFKDGVLRLYSEDYRKCVDIKWDKYLKLYDCSMYTICKNGVFRMVTYNNFATVKQTLTWVADLQFVNFASALEELA